MVKGFYTPPSRSGVSAGTVTGSDSDSNTGLVVGEGTASLRTDGSVQMTATTSGVFFRCPFRSVTSADSPVSVTSSDVILLTDSSSGSININLPAASTVDGRQFIIKDKGNAAGNSIVVSAASGQIDGFASVTVDNSFTAFSVLSDGSDYWVITG